jgi:diamine N-acetyltransferase
VPGPTITLREINRSNWRDVVDLDVREDQRRFVAPVSRYLCLCAYEDVWRPLGGYDGDVPVGFLMWGRDPADGSHWIGGVVVDAAKQGQGYGRAMLAAAVEFLRRLPGCTQIALSYQPENAVARALYASLGFVETGEREGDEVVARLELGST